MTKTHVSIEGQRTDEDRLSHVLRTFDLWADLVNEDMILKKADESLVGIVSTSERGVYSLWFQSQQGEVWEAHSGLPGSNDRLVHLATGGQDAWLERWRLVDKEVARIAVQQFHETGAKPDACNVPAGN
jgi:hypothetical protein